MEAETDVAIIVFDVSRPMTLENVSKRWLSRAEAAIKGKKKSSILLVGAKLDLRSGDAIYTAVSREEVKNVHLLIFGLIF